MINGNASDSGLSNSTSPKTIDTLAPPAHESTWVVLIISGSVLAAAVIVLALILLIKKVSAESAKQTEVHEATDESAIESKVALNSRSRSSSISSLAFGIYDENGLKPDLDDGDTT